MLEMNGNLSLNQLKHVPEPHGPVYNGPGSKKEYTPFCLPKLDHRQRDAIDKAKKYAMEQSIKSVLVKQTQQHQLQQMSNLKRTQALVLLSRIYVGSISYELKEDTIRQAFSPFGPIISVSLTFDPLTNKHKGFAFIEYALPEAAQLALEQMNGAVMGSRNIKVGRPSNMPQAQPIMDELVAESRLHNRIYVASVHPDLSEDDLRSVFEAFGKIHSCSLEPDPSRSGRHRGFGYIEYDTSQSATDAVSSMNLFDLGGQYLRVGKAITPPNSGVPASAMVMPAAAAVAAASITAKVIAMEAEQVVKATGFGMSTSGSPVSLAASLPPPAVVIPKFVDLPSASKRGDASSSGSMALLREEHNTSSGHQTWDTVEAVEENYNTSAKQHSSWKPNSKILVLRNMVGPDDCDEFLEAEVTEECSKFGSVERVVIYNERQGEEEDAEVIVKIFVVFDSPDSLVAACDSLNNRYFAGRLVCAEPYDTGLFTANDLSG